MHKNMKVGGFKLDAILYYTSNQCTPSNDPLKIQKKPAKKKVISRPDKSQET